LPASPQSSLPEREAAMLKRSLTEDAQEVFRAIALIELGARMQVLESELTLSRDRMIRLYREVKGASPPKGMLPFSADWYMTWLANIHASLFYNTYLFLKNEARCSHLDALTKGYRLYLEHCKHANSEPVLDLTRAWTLVRFFDADILQLTRCCRCTGKFVAHKHDLQNNVVCGACQPPSRAGKTKKAAAAKLETQTQIELQPQVAEPAVVELREVVEAIDIVIAQATIHEREPAAALVAA
jgi:flagellar transcriptional activator FlhC